MKTFELAYVGLGVHEELVSYAAQHLDLYRKAGVHVSVVDGRGLPAERLEAGAIVGLGHAQVDRMTQGTPWTILSVNTDYPLFWVMSRPEIESVEQLRGKRIACHPVGAGPRSWARLILRQAGLDPDRDVTLVTRRPGDYTQDFIGLGNGEIDAAFVGSAVLPEAAAARFGVRILVTVGEQFRIPTTGIAVRSDVWERNEEPLAAMVEAHREALWVIKNDQDLAERFIRGVVPGLTAAEAHQYYLRYVEPYFLADGRYRGDGWDEALALVGDELDVVEHITAHEIYPDRD